MGLKIKQGGLHDMTLMLLPLKQAGAQIAADMQADGTGKRCGVCGKPFNAARKWRGIARLTYGGERGRLLMVAWMLCGKCNHEAKRNGGSVPDCLKREAESVCEAARLAMTDAEGTA